MRRSEWGDRCKSHPEHHLSKGVCPFCLRERLSHISASSSTTNTTHASSSSTNSPYSTNSNLSAGAVVGATSSPPPAMVPSEGNTMKNSDMFQKSRSLAFDVDDEKIKEEIGQKHKDKLKKKKKKIERFFSKIIHGPSKKGESHDLHHSRTMKEKSNPKWVPF
ncbi:hypothetical protein LUZ62_032925 [Rhynchospora pubera]|uniref:Uncharacterized protein n=1 Tax=Rhynchospora pubera TaxID=906938 RepID=A0AAV8FTH0_9POAL|nr:hypothetical protein LUZ62_084906 [Rhynchospora pubera]KAJ4796552.1 hypothetical protein LUZ62_047798 [Rhynchospora pubera]KAJ4820359.1 hypothetical protein LUZ62_032925 [Rhynchospora pubera]